MFYRLGDVGAPNPHSLRQLSYASRFRAAKRTISVWRERNGNLDEARDEYGPCAWSAKSAHSNPWWDTPPPLTLSRRPPQDQVGYRREGQRRRDGKIDKLESKVKSYIQEQSDARRKGLQAATSRIILPIIHNTDIPTEVVRRIVLWVSDLANRNALEEDIQYTLHAAKSKGPFIVVGPLRTWFNGWTTSYRAHSHKTSCIFGCDEQDRLLHALRRLQTSLVDDLGDEESEQRDLDIPLARSTAR